MRLAILTTIVAAPALALPGIALALKASSVPLPPERPGQAVLLPEVEAPLPRTRPEGMATTAAEIELIRKGGFLAPVTDSQTAAATKDALNHIAAGRFESALAIQKKLSDPAARKLIEFYYVRDPSAAAPLSRIAAFLEENPDWPNQEYLRKRYEVALLAQRAKSETVLAAFETSPPTTSAGTVAMATALQATGDSERAGEMVRSLWRTRSLTDGEEKLVLDRFSDVLTRADHKTRMDRLLHNGETAAALRVAKRLGGDDYKLAEARVAVIRRSKSAGTALDKLPANLKSDPGYVLSRAQWQRRSGKYTEAAKLMLAAPDDAERQVAPDQWALERRILARELIETGDLKGAYELARRHAAESTIDRLENEWHAGWIALRYLDNPNAASAHFAELREIATTPISVARAEYWLGRAAEEAGDMEGAVRNYLAAGKLPTTYYGQLALARIGQTTVPRTRKPLVADTARRIVCRRDSMRAMRLLAQIGRPEEAGRHMISMANETDDSLTLVGISETAYQLGLKAATVWIGKAAAQAGAPTEAYAFATNGMPEFPMIGRKIDPAVAYAIARQESVFNPAVVSHAGARGLMQLMPATAKATAKAHGQTYDIKRLTSDARYNAALGAAHIGELVDRFGSAYALVFAAYNAGPGRVYEWIQRFGDPRKGEIDPVDWVELIPYSETRNYVQRVMEGLQVYRGSLGGSDRLMIAEDLRLPAAATDAVIAAETRATGGADGVPGVFSSFGDGPLDTGTVPSSALGFGGGGL